VLALVYLAWTPLGVEPVRRFLSSYEEHATGIDHDLVIVVNGGSARHEREDERISQACERVRHRLVVLDEPTLDLAAYGRAALQMRHERLCFVNSYSVILADEWLKKMADALDEESVGLAGASGSWESQSEWRRGRRRYWLYQLLQLRAARRSFPRFPNPHLRTTGFMLDRALALEMGLERAVDKLTAYRLESGYHSITRQVQSRGQRVVVVGRDGRTYDVADWPGSATFRAGGQRNLLIGDNRTREWESVKQRVRQQLSRDAWATVGHA
jgi:hypothetical protein